MDYLQAQAEKRDKKLKITNHADSVYSEKCNHNPSLYSTPLFATKEKVLQENQGDFSQKQRSNPTKKMARVCKRNKQQTRMILQKTTKNRFKMGIGPFMLPALHMFPILFGVSFKSLYVLIRFCKHECTKLFKDILVDGLRTILQIYKSSIM